MILGLSLSHDASAAITHDDGVVISALGEERISRVKNHVGIPRLAIRKLVESVENLNSFEKVVIGSHQQLSRDAALRMLAQFDSNPSNPIGKDLQLRPGALIEKKHSNLSPYELIESAINKILFEYGVEPKKYIWENHHYSHLGCALAATESNKNLLLSFDGHGDGESAAIATASRRNIEKKLISIPQLDSLGTLYSAVTGRYNFKPNQHEGKITGLAAFGSHSLAVDFLLKCIEVSEGKIRINYFKNKAMQNLISAIRSLGFKTKLMKSMEDIASMAADKTTKYEDLAFAMQFILENSILEITEYFVKKTGIPDLSLAGGVFSNVKLNQKITELTNVNSVTVFPNMGDGGIALGGIWRNLSKSGSLSSEPLYEDMFIAPIFSDTIDEKDPNINFEFMPENELIKNAALEISHGKLVAIHQNKMEFGPRALGNRSLLLDPRNSSIQQTVNKRLQRTEFMPFAPMVLEKFFDQFFISSNATRSPFYFMTMTCDVKKEVRHLIPAVTHIDGTARPQIVNQNTNAICNSIIEEFYLLTKIPVVVNTSLNVHEEPINYALSDSIICLRRGIIDVIYSETCRITLKN